MGSLSAGTSTRHAASASPIENVLDKLRALRTRHGQDPLSNPIQLLAIELAELIKEPQNDSGLVEHLTQELTQQAFLAHANHVTAYLGEYDTTKNEERVRAIFRQLAFDGDSPLPFPEFAARIDRLFYGYVFTAHPTFSFTASLQCDLMALALDRKPSGDPFTESERLALLEQIKAAHHRPETVMSLVTEHHRSLDALRNLLSAIRRLYHLIVNVSAELYPSDWRNVRPHLFSVASWVGYDTDGRSDISWRTSFSKRLILQIVGLDHHWQTVRSLREICAPDEPAGSLLELVEARLALAVAAARSDLNMFEADIDKNSRAAFARATRGMARTRPSRLRDGRELEELIVRCLRSAADEDLARALVVMLAEIRGQGLSAARTHVRINSRQLHNAIRKTIGMDHAPDDPTRRMTYQEAMAQLIADVRPVTINFGSLNLEKATAKRVFMMIAQMIKYLDSSEPIRFLIAETETAFTLLVALYYAKLFDVEKHVDISPLFETKLALERGAAILDDVLSVPAYKQYVQDRGRLCYQTGYSDAGRYLGQTAAAVAIERIRLDLIAVLQKHGLENIEVVIFDTHGESIGRGAHPASFLDRLNYVNTPQTRLRFRDAGIHVVQETSYQGGDGYVWFATKESSFAALTRVLEHVFDNPIAQGKDPFYTETVFAEEFFASVARFNATLIDHQGYAKLLGCYGSNLLYQTGSRAVRRQHDPGSPRMHVDHPSQIRAIPHNALLQQLGVLVNSIGGIGAASDKNPDQFFRLYDQSDRFRRLMGIVEYAFMFTDLSVTQAYLDRFNPGFWLARAIVERDEDAQEEFLFIAEQMRRFGDDDDLGRVFRLIQRDYMILARALRRHRQRTRIAGESPIVVDKATRDNLHMLHALRLAVMERMIRLAVHLPEFSDRHEATYEDVLAAIFEMEVEPALRVLSDIFPIIDQDDQVMEWEEVSSYDNDVEQSYRNEHERLFRPLARDYDFVRRLGSAITHHLGAVG